MHSKCCALAWEHGVGGGMEVVIDNHTNTRNMNKMMLFYGCIVTQTIGYHALEECASKHFM
jgi:hypothetical protein